MNIFTRCVSISVYPNTEVIKTIDNSCFHPTTVAIQLEEIVNCHQNKRITIIFDNVETAVETLCMEIEHFIHL